MGPTVMAAVALAAALVTAPTIASAVDPAPAATTPPPALTPSAEEAMEAHLRNVTTTQLSAATAAISNAGSANVLMDADGNVLTAEPKPTSPPSPPQCPSSSGSAVDTVGIPLGTNPVTQ